MRILAASLLASLVCLAAPAAMATTPDSTQSATTGTTTTGTTTTATTTIGATAPTPPKHLTPANDPDQVICKHDLVTGTRVPGPSQCHTRAEWERMTAAARDETDAQENTGSSVFVPQATP